MISKRENSLNIHIIGVTAFKCHTDLFSPFLSPHLRLFDAYHTLVFLSFCIYRTCTSYPLHMSHLSLIIIITISLFHLRGKYHSFITPVLFWVFKYPFVIILHYFITPVIFVPLLVLLAKLPNCCIVLLFIYRTVYQDTHISHLALCFHSNISLCK